MNVYFVDGPLAGQTQPYTSGRCVEAIVSQVHYVYHYTEATDDCLIARLIPPSRDHWLQHRVSSP